MPSVTVGSADFFVYADLEMADEYLLGNVDGAAKAWRKKLPDDRSAALVQATRWIQRQAWAGFRTAVAPGQPLVWPRTGVVITEGGVDVEIDPNTVPDDVVVASIELAALIAMNPEITTAIDQGSNIQALGAGPASISYFAPTSYLDGTALEWPKVIEDLLSKYRDGGFGAEVVALGGAWYGGSNYSYFDDEARLLRRGPL